jgi:hypothetical protein
MSRLDQIRARNQRAMESQLDKDSRWLVAQVQRLGGRMEFGQIRLPKPTGHVPSRREEFDTLRHWWSVVIACRELGWLDIVDISSGTPIYEVDGANVIKLTSSGLRLGKKHRGPIAGRPIWIVLEEQDAKWRVRIGKGKAKVLTPESGYLLAILIERKSIEAQNLPVRKMIEANRRRTKSNKEAANKTLLKQRVRRLRHQLEDLDISREIIQRGIHLEGCTVWIDETYLRFQVRKNRAKQWVGLSGDPGEEQEPSYCD